jgi:BA14K-like protein
MSAGVAARGPVSTQAAAVSVWAAARFNGGGGGAPVARFNGGGGGVPVARLGGGEVYRGGYGGGYRHGGGGFIPGAVAGAVIGGALASQSYAYYGGPGYYAPGYYDDQYYDDGAVAVAPAPVGDDAAAYCIQTYRSYDPASGTYLGYDGLRHPCP